MKKLLTLILGLLLCGALFTFSLHRARQSYEKSSAVRTIIDCLAPARAHADTLGGPFNPPPPPPPPID